MRILYLLLSLITIHHRIECSIPLVRPDFNALFSVNGSVVFEGPVGGGHGYVDVLDESRASGGVVDSTEALLAALATAGAGDVVFVPNHVELDLSGHANIAIGANVTLASGRGASACASGALLFTNDRHAPDELVPLFNVVGKHARVTGFRFRGPSGFIGNHHYAVNGVANLLRTEATHFTFDNNEVYDFDKWALYLYLQNGSRVHHNYFHHTTRTGFGYGVWAGGSGSENGTRLDIDHNVFNAHRHHIASHGGDHSWYAWSMIVLEQHLNALLDRHNDQGPTEGGHDTSVTHSWIASDSNEVLIVRGRPRNGGLVQFQHNVVEQRSDGPTNVVRLTNLTFDEPQAQCVPNMYGNVADEVRPRVLVRTSAPTWGARVGDVVAFDASESDGGVANAHYWWSFADGARAAGVLRYGAYACHRFEQPGAYANSVLVRDTLGVWQRGIVSTLVRPSASAYVLSAWWTDSCAQAAFVGDAHFELRLDGVVLYTTDVCASDNGWQNLVLDVGERVAAAGGGNGTSVTLTLEFVLVMDRSFVPTSAKETRDDALAEIVVNVDDVHVFGANVAHGDFEAPKDVLAGAWPRVAGSHGQYNALFNRNAVARGGVKALWIERGYLRESVAGAYVGVSQAIEFDAQAPDYDEVEESDATLSNAFCFESTLGEASTDERRACVRANNALMEGNLVEETTVRLTTSAVTSDKTSVGTEATQVSETTITTSRETSEMNATIQAQVSTESVLSTELTTDEFDMLWMLVGGGALLFCCALVAAVVCVLAASRRSRLRAPGVSTVSLSQRRNYSSHTSRRSRSRSRATPQRSRRLTMS